MRFSKQRLFIFIIVAALSFFLAIYQLPYYIYKPGGADALTPIVDVEGGFESEGDMHLVTVSGGQATPLQYILANINTYYEIVPLEQVRPKGISDDEYMHAQLQMMESSQQASIVVAYEAADKEINIEFKGAYVVSVLEGMPAEGVLEIGDRIIGIDGQEVKEADDLIRYISDQEIGTIVTVDIDREGDELTKEIALEAIESIDHKVGIGIQLVTDRNVQVDPEVHFSSGSIGGPSAGLMFSLEIYDQLTKDDLTKGYQVIGTGEVDYEGNVFRIGGIDKKVVAADKAGGDIFFAPNENGAEDSNYHLAKATAEEIGTEMEIVPVDTFLEALTYLQNIEPKE